MSGIDAIINENHQNLKNFKGIYFNDDNLQTYFENGAHFRYSVLCGKLEKLVLTLSPGRRGKTMYEQNVFSDRKGKIYICYYRNQLSRTN